MLRELHWHDIDELVGLEGALFPDDPWAAPTWWAELAGRPRREYLVDDEGGAIRGYLGIDHGGDTADVMTIAVAPSARGTGLGDVLLAELVRRAGDRGARALLLEVRADNDAARRLYDRSGFETIGVRRRYYQPGDVDALVMRRHLEGAARSTDQEATRA